MQLTIINSNSSGNAYVLHNKEEALLIECGVRIDRIMQAIGFSVKKVVGCLVTHEHKDHCKAIFDVMNYGINVYASQGTHQAIGSIGKHRAKTVVKARETMIGGFKVLPFDVKHDCAEPLGFLISHQETGTVLFLTDSYYTEYTFGKLHNVIIEANYCETILQKKLDDGNSPKFLRDRVIESHMSLQTCKQTLKANDLSAVHNIVLIHLSDSHSDATRFKKEVEQITGKVVHIADAGLTIENFNKQPF
jgi:phosphoribosyl 1,2-cyclic phosphodiesterase